MAAIPGLDPCIPKGTGDDPRGMQRNGDGNTRVGRKLGEKGGFGGGGDEIPGENQGVGALRAVPARFRAGAEGFGERGKEGDGA